VDLPLPHARTQAHTHTRHTVLTRVVHVSGPHLLVHVPIVPCEFVVCEVWYYWSVGIRHIVVLYVLLVEDWSVD
jgi:hypothetical protein